MIRIGYFIQNESFIQSLFTLYTLRNEIQLIELKTETEQELMDKEIQLVIFEFKKEETQRLEHFEMVKSRLGIRGICVIEHYSNEMIEAILSHQIQYYCDYQISKEGLMLLVLRLLNEIPNRKFSKYEIIEEVMKDIQIPQHLMGYDYIKTALLYLFEHEQVSMQDINQAVANKYHTTQSRVERNIRKAISSASLNKGIEKISNYKFIMQCYQECKEKQHG